MARDDSGQRLASHVTDRRTVLKGLGVAGISGLSATAGCISGGGGGSDTEATFGIINPMSGGHSPLGKPQRNGAKLAVNWVNENLDVTINPVYEDTQSKPSVARSKAQKTVSQDGASFLAGTVNSSASLSVADYADGEEVVFSAGGASMAISGADCNPYTFQTETPAALHAAGLVPYTVENLGKKMWIMATDYAYGNSAIEWIRRRMDQYDDAEIVGVSKPQPGTDNYGPYIDKIMNSDADVTAVPINGGDLIKFMKQARSKGLGNETEIIGTAIFARPIRAALGDAAVGAYSSTLYNHKLETGDNEQFVQAFTDEYGNPPDSFARVGYESVRMAAKAIEEAGSTDPETVHKTMEDLKVETVLADESWYRSCDHLAMNPVWTGKVVKSSSVPEMELVRHVEKENAMPPCDARECQL